MATVTFVPTTSRTLPSPAQAPSVWSETADKITSFFTRIEGIGTVFSILAGAAIAAFYSVGFGLIISGMGLAVSIATGLCRSEESKSPAINIHNDQGKLSVVIDTERFHIRSVESTKEDHDNYAALFGDPATMEKYATGETKSREYIVDRIDNSWVKRWHNNDPYSALAIFKRGGNAFVGHIVLGHGDQPGESEMAIVLKPEHWNKRYGTEIVTALFYDYAPAIANKGYLLEGKPLERIVATGRPDNIAVCNILLKSGMYLVRTEEKYGAMRNHYAIELTELQKRASREGIEAVQFKLEKNC